jgi:tRNA (Thr-GGU) A37 N-methylase
VVFLFDRVAEDEVTYDARHPRGNRSWPKVGIFAQRGKNRPSPHRGERLSHSGCARAVARR